MGATIDAYHYWGARGILRAHLAPDKTHPTYGWLVGKSYQGRGPGLYGRPDGRTITVLEVKETDSGPRALVQDSTGHIWTTVALDAIARDIRKESE